MPSVFTAGSASVNIVPDFQGAQQKIAAWFAGQNDIKVGVQPNLDNAAMARVNAQIASNRSEVKVGVDHDYLAQSIAKAMDSLTGTSTVASVIAKTLSPALFAGAIGGLSSMAAAASQAGGALALIPAAVVGLAAPVAVLTIGVQGMGDAFAAFATGDVVKVQEALNNLAPAARSFVLQMHELAPAFSDLRLDIQQQLFTGVGSAVADLSVRWLPTLNAGLTGLATEMRQTALQGLAVANSMQSISDGATTFRNLTAATNELNPVLGNLVAIWRDFSVVGSSFLPGLAAGLADLVNRTREWTAAARESGVLFDIISAGLSMIGELAQLLMSVARVLYELFRPAIEAGTQLISLFTDLLNKVADFLALDTTQSQLKIFFDGIAEAFRILQPAIMAVVSVLTTVLLPALGQLFVALAPLVNTVLVQFAALFQALAPIIPVVAVAITALLTAVSPLIPVLTQIIVAILPVLAQLVTDLAPIVGALADALGRALLSALQVISPILPLLADAFVRIVQAVAPLLPALLNLALQLLPPLVSILEVLIPPLVQIAEALFPALVQVINALAPILPPLINAFLQLVQAILPILPALVQLVVFLLPPLTELIKLLIPVLTFMVQVWTTVINVIVTVITWVIALITQWRDARDAIIEVATMIRDWVVARFTDLINIVQAAWSAFISFLTSMWTACRDAVVGLAQNILEWIVARFTQLVNTAVGLFTGLRDTAISLFVGLRDGVVNVAQQVWDWVVDKFTRMRDAVISVFTGLVDGVKTVWNAIKGVMATPINFVINTILNNGLFAAWNWLVTQLGLPANWHAHIDPIPGYATGGRIQGYSPSPRADNIPIMATAGEFVVQQPIASRTGNFLEALNNGEAEAIQAAGGWNATGPHMATGGVVAAINHAKSMQGRPYIWGGVGPGGADCSGFMSQLTNVLRGANPYSRLGTTATFPWSGFQPGLGSQFAIGNSRLWGHMAGTLAGNAVESGSGHGPQIGGNALSATSPMFSYHGFLPEAGGAFAGASANGSITVPDPWYVKLWHTVGGAFTWLQDSIKGVGQMAGRFGGSPLIQMLTHVPSQIMGALWDKVKGTIGGLFSSFIGTNNDTAGVKGVVQGIFRNRGWGDGAQWAATDYIVGKESSWNAQAQNPTSSASGLFQMIDGTWATYGNKQYAHMKDAPANDQGLAGAKYIGTRYGDPMKAKTFWDSHHWYDHGGWLPPGISTVFNGTGRPEPVLTAHQNDSLNRWKHYDKRGRGHHDRDGLMRDVHIHAEHDRASDIMDELWHRLNVAKRGGVYSTASVSMAG